MKEIVRSIVHQCQHEKSTQDVLSAEVSMGMCGVKEDKFIPKDRTAT